MSETFTPNHPMCDSKKLPNYFVHATLFFVAFSLLTLGVGVWNYFAAKEDAAIAQRQQHTSGTITHIETGRGSTYYFEFAYQNQSYLNSVRGGIDHSIGDEVTVFFDPQNPHSSDLSDFYQLSAEHKAQWKSDYECAPFILAFALLCWYQALLRKREIESIPINQQR